MRTGGGGGGGAAAAAGQNPASGVVVWYFLKDKPADGVSLEILDRISALTKLTAPRGDPTAVPEADLARCRAQAESEATLASRRRLLVKMPLSGMA